MGQHALLSPSGASRWLACTPSARLEAQFPDRAGEAAKEGTLAHALGELLIGYTLRRVTRPDFKIAFLTISQNPLYDNAMMGHCEEYLAFVMERYAEAQTRSKDAMIFLEKLLELSRWVPEGSGTGDVIIIADGILDLIDLKYGKGVPVSAENNKQLMLYALGALDLYSILYDIHTVRVSIFQPRIDNQSTWTISVDALLNWAEEELVPKAKMAFAGIGEFKPGDHCMFCRAKANCKANAEEQLKLAQYEFREGALLADEEIVDILNRIPNFEKWLKAIKEHTLHEAVANDKHWPGYKLVEGKSNRKYTSEADVIALLQEKGYALDEFSTRKIFGITEMTGFLKKKTFDALLSPLLIKPPGKPALVPVSDKREELNSLVAAQREFADEVDLED